MSKLISRSILCLAILTMQFECYNPDDQITSIDRVAINVADDANIYADSSTVHKVEVVLPGLKFGNAKKITITTDWGTWPNQQSTIVLTAPYDKQLDYYHASTTLLTGRTAKLFTISLLDDDKQVKSNTYQSLPRVPDRVQILADSSTIKLKAGSSSNLKVLFYSDIGFPSYGFKFSFTATSDVSFIPIEQKFDKGNHLGGIVRLTHGSTAGPLIIGGEIKDLKTQPDTETVEILIQN